MQRSLRIGSAVYASGIAAMGALMLLRPDVPPVLLPLPALFPGRIPLTAAVGACLVLAATLILLDRKARTAARALAALISLSTLLHIAPVLAALETPAWAVAFETVAIGAAAWTLAGLLGTLSHQVKVAARYAFGVALIAFGTFHFVHHAYIENAVPNWIPGHAFWTYGIGCALIAAGLAIATRIKGQLAAMLLAVMFGSWVIIVHAPRVAAALSNVDEWSSLFIALICCGASWIQREGLRSDRAPR